MSTAHRYVPALVVWCALAGCCGAFAQTAEMTSKEVPFTIRTGVNLVPVPVVVRDAKGHAVGNLSPDDFQLFDNGKPQLISKFTVEKMESAAVAESGAAHAAAASPGASEQGVPASLPEGIAERFVAYLFDDLHMSVADLNRTREAARRQIDSSAHAVDRVAIYTTSGQTTQEFSANKEKLHAALAALGTGHASSTKTRLQSGCPPMTYYMGDLIYNKNDANTLNLAVADAIRCANLTPQQRDEAVKLAQVAARDAVSSGDQETELSLNAMRAIVSRLASMPGQRSIVLISPGFLVLEDRIEEQTGIIERAIRANVVIGALDARGLFTAGGITDASANDVNPNTITQKTVFLNQESIVQADVMANVASGTGGTFYHGTNDFDEGIARTAATPEYLYVLSFSPLDLKTDGRYHSLKVTLKTAKGVEVEARKGYYAPKTAADPAAQAKEAIEESFFSREEVHDLPAALVTQYFKGENGAVTLSAVAKIDVRKLPFRKENGRNLNNVTVVEGVFDNDGNYVAGQQKVIELRLLDETLEKRLAAGISVKNSFSVSSGKYVVRMVVRDSEGQSMAAQSSLVEIP